MTPITPPSGELTFLFTDVQGSSTLWEHDAPAMSAALAEHDRRLGAAVAKHGGYVFTTAGDSFAVAFPDPMSALAATVDAQLMLDEPAPAPAIHVRMGIHTGTAIERNNDYFGPVLNRCARLMSVGHGGQILVSGTTARLLRSSLPADWRLIDLGEHHLKDLEEPEHIFQMAHPELGRDFAPLRTMDALTSSIPLQLTSFVGRSKEVDEITGLMRRSRMVTLAGSGGAGKTRLGLHVSTETTRFPGGVVLAELGAITDPDLVDVTIAAAFSAQESSSTALIDSVANKIGERDLLLMIDNCEHVVDAVAPHIARLLTRCPELTVLATSQAPIGVPGEAVYRVPSMSVPDDDASITEALSAEAVALFAERAALARPAFRIDESNIDDIVAICRRLDGIPLALELAAARLAVLTPHQVNERLDERFRLLRRGSKLSHPRHETLEMAIRWSHDLLDTDEQALLRRCGIFPGSFSLEAVEEICSDDALHRDDVLDLLAALIDKSLVVADEAGDALRYRLLTSINAYALKLLDEHGETNDTAARHLAYFTTHSASLQHLYRNDALAAALDGLRNERDNIRSALDNAFASGALVDAGKIVGAIGYLWYTDGAFHEGIDWCERLFAFDVGPEVQPDGEHNGEVSGGLDLTPYDMAAALHAYGTLLGSWSDPQAGGDLLERAVTIRRELGDPLRLAAALNNLGNMWNDAGSYLEAEAALTEAVELLRANGQDSSMSLAGRGWGRMHRGDFAGAAVFLDEAVTEAERVQNALGVAVATGQAGQCAAYMERHDKARRHVARAHAIFTELGIAPGLQDVELTLAVVERSQGHRSAAAQHLLDFLVEPDAHWYLSAKFWAIQLAASLIDDLATAAELLGGVDAHDASINEVQPTYYASDGRNTRTRLMAALGDASFTEHHRAGCSAEHRALVTTTKAALRLLITEPAEPAE